ncbi:MAG: hypothetical protein P4L43_14960 [Syntrophobacteraceae bacterium]|nr:hypothetical protein [Syntrophobacteraceae bacterium]
METPSRRLAEKIMQRLIGEGLLTDRQGKKLIPKLESGKISQEDWRLALELSDSKEGQV